jgi:hypothetical protein
MYILVAPLVHVQEARIYRIHFKRKRNTKAEQKRHFITSNISQVFSKTGAFERQNVKSFSEV